MIVSHKHRFIFIKTHKTAGSSLEMALAPLCGEEDIIAPMESNAHTDVPRNFHGTAPLDRLYARSRTTRKLINRHSKLLGKWYYEHMPAWRVREQVGEDIWNSYYKFCFERNPWEKVVSYYLWKKHGQQRKIPSFREYVLCKPHRLPMDARLYMEQDRLMLDCVYEFKNLTAETSTLFRKLNLPFSGQLPREKTGIQTNRRPYQEYYDQETQARVADIFSREIGLLGYTFD